MKQIVKEYWQFNTSITKQINIFLENNPNYKIESIHLSSTDIEKTNTHNGIYALVVFKKRKWCRK